VVRKESATIGTPQYWLSLTDAGHASCAIGGFASVIAGSVPLGQWSHLACTYDRQNLRLYVNGIQVGSTVATQPIPGPTLNNLYIGAEEFSYDKNFFGLIDEVAIYNRALSAAEIQAINDAGSAGKCLPTCTPIPAGAVAWWAAAGNANDLVGTNNGILQGGTTFAQGRVGQGFSFDGNSDDVVFGSTVGNFGSSDFTIEFWIKSSSTLAQNVLSKRPICDHSSFWHISMQNVPFIEVDQDATGTGYGTLSATTAISDDAFHHVAFIRQGLVMQVYIDGALNNSATFGVKAFISNSATVYAGWSPCQPANSHFFDGVLDEISLYNRALTATEVQAIYNAGEAGKCLTPLYITSFSKISTNVGLSWLAQPGVGYRAQYATNLGASPWLDVSGDVLATGSTAAKGDTVPVDSPQRVYRVEMLR
jgi:hypothetical protein